jgi:hypothetical protein
MLEDTVGMATVIQGRKDEQMEAENNPWNLEHLGERLVRQGDWGPPHQERERTKDLVWG